MKGTLRFSVKDKTYDLIVEQAWAKIVKFLDLDSVDEAKSKVDVSTEVQPAEQENIYQAEIYVRIR